MGEEKSPMEAKKEVSQSINIDSEQKSKAMGNEEHRMRIKKEVYKSIIEKESKKVVEICKENEWVLGEMITASGDTVLHKIVSQGQEDMVEQLQRFITREKLEEANIRGNNLLHMAASVGSVMMCKSFTALDSEEELMKSRNKDGETPLFLSVLYGRKEAFLCLHELSSSINGDQHCLCLSRRSNGDTILHCAIDGDYFELALLIIERHKDLVSYVNAKSISPLHLLATKPDAFRSGSRYGWSGGIIYKCIGVGKPSETTSTEEMGKEPQGLFWPLKNSIYSTVCPKCCNSRWRRQGQATDVENSPSLKGICVGKPSEKNSTEEKGKEPQGLFWRLKNSIYSTGICVGKPSEKNSTEEKGKEPQGLFWRLKNSIYSTVCAKNCNSRWRRQEHTTNVENPQELNASLKGGSKSNEEDSQGFSTICAKFVMNKLFGRITKIKNEKEKHAYAAKVLEELAKISARHEYYKSGYYETGGKPMTEESMNPKALELLKRGLDEVSGESSDHPKMENEQKPQETRTDRSPILVAAQNGIKEVVETIIEHIPMAINDMDSKGKNVVLLAAENRRSDVYKLLLSRFGQDDSIFHKIDDKGNTALHHAAMKNNCYAELNPSSTVIMQWEIMWFKYIKNSMPSHLVIHLNEKGKTAKEVFTKKHKRLLKEAGEEVKKIAESCSVVATLVATVAFATSVTIPGGPNHHGTPILENQPAFTVFAISSLLALCSSVAALLTFLSILTTRHSEKDFGKKLPRKTLLGMISLLVSLALMVISYCSGHFFLLKDRLKLDARAVYAILGAVITLFTIFQFLKSFDFFKHPRSQVPHRGK